MQPTLVILAAGMGSRYGGLKQVDGLGPAGETIIDYSVYDALRAGFGKIVFVIRKHIEKEFLQVFGERFKGKADVDLAFQELDMLPEGFVCPSGRQKPWGTAHAVWVAQEKVKGPFAVINADDFYGHDAFRIMADALKSHSHQTGKYHLAGYRLANTLSDQGSVSRAICTTDENGYLETIVERKHIERINNKICFRNEEGECTAVDENALVSMNFLGFTPDYFQHTTELFKSFLQQHKDDSRAEFFIPFVIDELIKQGKATCKVWPTSAEWFGVTYPGDKPVVMNKLKRLTEDGTYPTPLW